MYFTNEFAFMSNFYERPFGFNRMGRTFVATSAESAFQSFKTLDAELADKICKMKPAQAKRTGNQLQLRSDWLEIREKVMERILFEKFGQNKDLALKLYEVSTKKSIVFENKHNDTFWGVVNGQGENKLGKILEQLAKNPQIIVIDKTKSILKKEKRKAKKNKFTEYAIIDHVGSVDESVLKRVYNKAFGMIENGLTAYTMKKFCLTINPNVRNLDSMKNSMRMSKNPKQIVLIVGADNMNSPYSQKNTPIGTSTSQWVSKTWLERCNNVTILQVIEDRIYEYSAEDIDPTLFKLFEPTNSIERQYAAIWGPALDYHFSAPLYKDDFYAMKEESLKRAGYAPESGSYSCKRTTRPEKYRVTKQIASEEEVREFYYNYFLYFKESGTLEEFLSPDYKICPHCGNPVNINAPECTCHHENPYYVGLEFSSYYDTEELDEEDFLDDFEEKEEIFDIDEF